MGWEWIGPLVMALASGAMIVLKGLWGTDKPQDEVVEHAKPDVEGINDGKSDKARLTDLGI